MCPAGRSTGFAENLPQTSSNRSNIIQAVSQDTVIMLGDTMKRSVNLRKTMVVFAIAFALGGSALSTSAFARSSFGSGRPAAGYAYDSDHVSNLHRGFLQRHGRGYARDRRGYYDGQDPWVTGGPTTAPCFEFAV